MGGCSTLFWLFGGGCEVRDIPSVAGSKRASRQSAHPWLGTRWGAMMMVITFVTCAGSLGPFAKFTQFCC